MIRKSLIKENLIVTTAIRIKQNSQKVNKKEQQTNNRHKTNKIMVRMRKNTTSKQTVCLTVRKKSL